MPSAALTGSALAPTNVVPITAGTEQVLDLYRTLAAGVGIVSVAGRDGPTGMTATALTSVSLHPPLLLVCLASHSRTLAWIERRGGFGLSLLGAHQQDVARGFALPGGRRFTEVPHDSVRGVPVLRECLAWSVCRVTDSRAAGDHHVVLGRVVATRATGGAPLVWHDRDFAGLTRPASSHQHDG